MTKTKKLVTSALLIATATVLSLIQPISLPFGGGITAASMMPIVLCAFIFGAKSGLFAAFIFSLLQLALGGKAISAMFMPGDGQMVLWQAVIVCLSDYIVAYTVIGLGGIFKNKMKSEEMAICLGSGFALLLRYIVHIISGAIFYGAWAEWFFSQEGFYKIGQTILENFSGSLLSIIYSVFYNGLYMIPEIIITMIITPVIYKLIKKAI